MARSTANTKYENTYSEDPFRNLVFKIRRAEDRPRPTNSVTVLYVIANTAFLSYPFLRPFSCTSRILCSFRSDATVMPFSLCCHFFCIFFFRI